MANKLASFASDAVYRARRHILVDGVSLKPGDLLPSDSPLRADQRRIELMIQTRQLMPGSLDESGADSKKKKVAEAATSSATSTPTAAPAKVTAKADKPVVKKPSKPAIDVDDLSKTEVISHLTKLGLKTSGSKEQMVERLRIALS